MKIKAISQADGAAEDDVNVAWLLLHCIGFGACWAWVHIGFFSPVLLGDQTADGTLAWLVNLVANGITMVAAGLAARNAYLSGSRAMGAAACGLVLFGTFATALLKRAVPQTLWLALGPVATGVGTALLLLLWAEAYRDISLYRAKKYTLPGAMAGGALIYLLVVALTETAAVVACAMLPVLSVVCQKITYHPGSVCEDGMVPHPADEEPSGAPTAQRRALLRFVLIISVYCLPSGFISGTDVFTGAGAGRTGALMFGGIAVLLIAVVVLSVLFIKPGGGDFAYRMIVPLMAGGLLLMPFVTGNASAVANVAIMGGYIILEMFVWSTLQEIARTGHRSPAFVFGIGKSGMNLGLFIGCMLGMFASRQSTVPVLGISILIVYVFILLGALSPNKQRAALLPPVHPSDDVAFGAAVGLLGSAPSAMKPSAQASQPSVDELRAKRCRELAERYELSAREEDVLGMLSYGRSLDVIASTLGIAPSTVRSHRDHIYRKLGIHNRQELLDIVDGK